MHEGVTEALEKRGTLRPVISNSHIGSHAPRASDGRRFTPQLANGAFAKRVSTDGTSEFPCISASWCMVGQQHCHIFSCISDHARFFDLSRPQQEDLVDALSDAGSNGP